MNNHSSKGMHAGAQPEIFRFAEKLRAKMTFEEKKLWSFLRSKPLDYKFRRQHPFNKYILDFYCHKARLSIEVDGVNHNDLKQKMIDSIRTELIISYQIKEIRYTNEAIRNNFEEVKRSIISILQDGIDV